MRTTLDIDDSVLAVARARAREKGISVGAAVSELVRRGLAAGAESSTSPVSGFPVFDAPAGAPVVSDDVVRQFRDSSDG